MKTKKEMTAALAPTRMRNQTNKSSVSSNWTVKEDDLLIELVRREEKPNWANIAQNFPNKTITQVNERYDKVINPNLRKGSWTAEEDKTILDYVNIHGAKNWTKLSKLLHGRIGKQCRERYKNHLDPSINHSPFTPEEDEKIIELQSRYGNKWVRISNEIGNRSDNAIKNRWNSTLRHRNIINRNTDRVSTINHGSEPAKEIPVPLVTFIGNDTVEDGQRIMSSPRPQTKPVADAPINISVKNI